MVTNHHRVIFMLILACTFLFYIYSLARVQLGAVDMVLSGGLDPIYPLYSPSSGYYMCTSYSAPLCKCKLLVFIFLCFPMDESYIETEIAFYVFTTVTLVTKAGCGVEEVLNMCLQTSFILERFLN